MAGTKPGHDEKANNSLRRCPYRSGIGGRITGPSSDGTVASGSGAGDTMGCDTTGCGNGGGGSGGGTA
jgi:hypothetical protein